MFVNERYDEILRILKEQKSVSASKLAKQFGVSLETIRRDLYHLETKNLLQRVHGGAIAPSEMNEYKTLERRREENVSKKIQCAENAMHFINESDVIFIDTGSTAKVFARVLKNQFQSLTVITHSLDVCLELRDHPGFRLIIIGGEYAPDETANCGILALDMIENLHAAKAFIFPLAISLEKGLCDQETRFIAIERAYMARADKIYFVADSSKFETTALVRICPLGSGQIFITDNGLNEDIRAAYAEAGVEIYC